MRKSWATQVLVIVLLGAGLGCSNQYRDADYDLGGKDVIARINVVENGLLASGSGSSASQRFFGLKDDPNSTIYFAHAPSSLGPVVSVFSVDFDFLGTDFLNVSFSDLAEVDVAFVVLPVNGGDECALMIYPKSNNQELNLPARFFTCVVPATVEDGEFVAELQDAQGVGIVLRSFDVSKGTLNDVIQLRLSDFDRSNQEIDRGKFSTLVAFGP